MRYDVHEALRRPKSGAPPNTTYEQQLKSNNAASDWVLFIDAEQEALRQT